MYKIAIALLLSILFIFSPNILRAEENTREYEKIRITQDFLDGPYVHFKLNDSLTSTTVVDDGDGLNDGNASTNTVNLSEAGKIINCFNFDLLNEDHVLIDDVWDDIKNDETGSITFWMKADVFQKMILAFGDTEGTQSRFQIQYDSVERLWIGLLLETGVQWEGGTAPGSVLLDNWYHVVVTHDGVEMKIYLNGINQPLDWGPVIVNKSFWFSALSSWADNGRLGCRNYQSQGNADFFDGQIDDFRYYKFALNAAEVWALYNYGNGTEEEVPPSKVWATGPFMHYKLNDNEANNVVVDDGDGFNDGAASTNTMNLSVTGKINNSFEFDPLNEDHAVIDDVWDDIKNDETGSITFWMKANAYLNPSMILSFGDTEGSNARFQIMYDAPDSQLWVLLSRPNPFGIMWEGGTALGSVLADNWYHVVVTQDAVEMKIFLNGISQSLNWGPVNPDKSLWYSSVSSWVDNGRLGCRNHNGEGNTYFYDGRIDDFRYYRYALKQVEIDALYNNGNGTEEEVPGIQPMVQPRSLWRYTFQDTVDPSWTSLAYNDSSWQEGHAPFGNTQDIRFGCGAPDWCTEWSVRDSLWLRKKFWVSEYRSWNLYYGVDNAVTIYLNGLVVVDTEVPGFPTNWEGPVFLPDSLFNFGWNILAVRLRDTNYPGNSFTAFDMFIGDDETTAINETQTGSTPHLPTLYQNYPNPFNPATTIRYDLSQKVSVSLTIYDVNGRIINRLVHTESQPPGTYYVAWDGRNNSGNRVATGIYFYRLTAGDCVQAKKMVLLK